MSFFVNILLYFFENWIKVPHNSVFFLHGFELLKTLIIFAHRKQNIPNQSFLGWIKQLHSSSHFQRINFITKKRFHKNVAVSLFIAFGQLSYFGRSDTKVKQFRLMRKCALIVEECIIIKRFDLSPDAIVRIEFKHTVEQCTIGIHVFFFFFHCLENFGENHYLSWNSICSDYGMDWVHWCNMAHEKRSNYLYSKLDSQWYQQNRNAMESTMKGQNQCHYEHFIDSKR